MAFLGLFEKKKVFAEKEEKVKKSEKILILISNFIYPRTLHIQKPKYRVDISGPKSSELLYKIDIERDRDEL